MREVSLEEIAENVGNPTFGDDTLGVVFYSKTVEDVTRTQAEGRRCFREREYVKIMVPGDRHNVIDRPVQQTGILPTDDRMRFPKQYLRFKQRQEQQAHEGTPLSLWTVMPTPLAEELKFLNVFTIEQLAELADGHIAKIHGGVGWKEKAREFVQAQKDTALVTKLQAQLGERDNRIDTLEKALKDQSDKMESMARKIAKLEK